VTNFYEKHKDQNYLGIGMNIVGKETLLKMSSFDLNAPISVQTGKQIQTGFAVENNKRNFSIQIIEL